MASYAKVSYGLVLSYQVTFLTNKQHFEERDLEAQTKDSEIVDKKASPQAAAHSECVGNSERGTCVKGSTTELQA